MTNDQDKARIRLAEAMDRMPRDSKTGEVIPWEHIPEAKELMLGLIPNPFECANDDYAVRDFFMDGDKATKFVTALIKLVADRVSGGRPYVFHIAHLKIGDYARAALKILPVEGGIPDEWDGIHDPRPGHD
jgi:hypothetical protein